ncbi:C4-dicarboxylic acid transporter DauA [bacterium]|nr:C4-dicarboxylic acid transporter DauA [bacterium]
MNRWMREVRRHLAPALRGALAEGYTAQHLVSDLLAGASVGVIALPLAMALAIASGAPPQHGLYTVIVAGLVIALLSGSRFSVSGPTAAFVVVLAPVARDFGLGGLLLATLMAGCILIFMGLGGMGRLIQFIPYPVTTGFTSGIAVVIATLQVKDFLGLSLARAPENLPERLGELLAAAPTLHPPDLLVGAFTLSVLIFWKRWNRRLPAPLLATLLAAVLAFALDRLAPDFHAATIGDRFTFQSGGTVYRGIPSLPPLPLLPWSLPGPDGEPLALSLSLLRALVLPATTIAILGAIESLLCAVVADGMAGTRHDPDAELLAQGVGNVVVPFFGGLPATAAIARTAAILRAGAKSPWPPPSRPLRSPGRPGAGPAAGLSCQRCLGSPCSSWSPGHGLKHFRSLCASRPAATWSCLDVLLLTVIFDMVVAVSVRIMLAAMLFYAPHGGNRRHAPGRLRPSALHRRPARRRGPHRIAGPLLLRRRRKAMSTLQNILTTIWW